MSFRYIVMCDQEGCSRIQGILTSGHKLRNDGGGVYPWELEQLGWEEDDKGRHTCSFCANPCPQCDGEGQVDCERPPGTYINCSGCGGTGIAPAGKEKGEN